MDAVAISFQFTVDGPVAESGSEDALAWNTLFSLLKQSLAEAEQASLQARWQALQGAYHPLQAQVLQVLRTAQEGAEHAG